LSLGRIGGDLVNKFVKQTKIDSWLAHERGVDKPRLVEAKPDERASRLWQERSGFDTAHCVLDQDGELPTLLVRNSRPKVLNFGQSWSAMRASIRLRRATYIAAHPSLINLLTT